ncbi:MAG: hypothetical protein IT383_05110 [Deltaproteobacteria bacterium]|nr:hypothetical protein [Deltaproteobacteria bacterium]
MNARPAQQLPHAAALLGDVVTVTLFDPGAPATCLSVRLCRRGASFEGVVAAAGMLADRLRLGLQPGFFCVVDGAALEGTLELRVREHGADALALEAQVASAAPAGDHGASGSIPRT